jgi:nuclear transport factor 2 (NTF2) superfamily protein
VRRALAAIDCWRPHRPVAVKRLRRSYASINDLAIDPERRKFLWDAPGPRPLDHPGLTAFGL